MSSNQDALQDEDEISPPMLVKIQTIDLQTLDFQTNIGGTAKFRHLTYIEATNLFLFVGSTSGSVYVFSRDALKFLFIIPFKGGKVCNITCSQDESDIAVGSIRGKVSIYRISQNVHYMQLSSSAPLIDAFRFIYDIPHHHGSEITDMQWSPNGKYLFVGDSQGIVSQMDVACFDEFPRPVPSKIILKLQTRVLQMDCSFPYLAVCTLAAVFLCDLEKEDFTRVQHTKNTDIRSTGLCLMILPERSSLRDLAKEMMIPSAKLMLFIGEAGVIHCCNMEGNVQHSKKIVISDKVSTFSMPLFDPTKAISLATSYDNDDDNNVSISLGKMLCTDDGMIVSISCDRLFVYDPYTLNVIAWNEDFKRINNFKIISNYAFIWAGNKLDVLAFTPFRSYAEQLFRAKLIEVLESWIVHTIYSLGWRQPQQNSSSSEDGSCCSTDISRVVNAEKTAGNFKKMIFSEGEEESEFTQFVIKQLPFSITTVEDAPPEQSIVEDIIVDQVKTMEQPVRAFLSEVHPVLEEISLPAFSADTSDNTRISSSLTHILKKTATIGQHNSFQIFAHLWKKMLVFYEEIECVLPQLDYKKSDLTLNHVLNAAQCFIGQHKLVNIKQEISDIAHLSAFEDLAMQMIVCLYAQQKHFHRSMRDILQCSLTTLPFLCFTKLTQCPVIIQWFRELGVAPEAIFFDALLADTLLLLLPLLGSKEGTLLTKCLDHLGVYEKLTKNFMTWLFLCIFLHKAKPVPYSALLRSLVNDQLFDTLAEEMFSTIYRDFRLSNFTTSAHFLHHFVSLLVFLSKMPDCTRPRTTSILLSCFPLTKWASEDIVTKIIAACHLNPSLLGLYLKACLEDGNSMKLCSCGIQAGYGTVTIAPWQKAVEEAVIKLLLEEYFKSSSYDDEESQDGNGNNTQKRRTEMLIHMFAMRRGLLASYFRSPLPDEFLSDEMQAELIIRSGTCASLKYYPCNNRNIQLILSCYQNDFVVEKNSRDLVPPKDNLKMIIFDVEKGHKFSAGRKQTDEVGKNMKCASCSAQLQIFSTNFKPLSMDCLAIWALKQVGDLVGLSDLIQKCDLNVPGIFSPRFYRAAAKYMDGENNINVNEEGEIESVQYLSCSEFH